MSAALIVGGGPVGAALALAWEKPATLFAPESPRGGRYYALNAAAENFLTNSAGVQLPECVPVRRFLLQAGGRDYRLDAPDNLPLCRIVGEDALMRAMQIALVRKGTEVHSAAPESLQTGENGVCARLRDGGAFSAPLLVAADGARSAAARMLHIGAAVSSFGQRALTMILTAQELADDVAAQWFSRRDIMALLPVGAGKFALVWSLPDSAARDMEKGGADAVVAAVRARTGFSVSAADDSAPRGFALSAVRRAVRVAVRTAFVGDAARVIHPLAGQGLNAGLSDCSLLLDFLRRYENINAALAKYAAHGGRRGAALHEFTRLMNRFGGAASPLFAAVSRHPFNRWARAAANFN